MAEFGNDGIEYRPADTPAADQSFTPTTPADWSPTPTTVQQALDQLASRVAALE